MLRLTVLKLVGVALILGLSSQLSKAQHLLSTKGQVIVNAQGDTVLLRGMGLGGWMLQEGYMLQTAGFANPQHKIRAAIEDLIGIDDTDQFYEAWLSNHVRKTDIDSLKSWGFNSVRLPMHYNLFTLPIEEEPTEGQHTWLEKGFELTDSLISWCRQNEMYVIMDLHAAPGGQGYDAGISDYDDTKPSLWESKANRDKTVALWKKIAERYADEQWVAGYDLLNEPNWNLPGNILLRNLYREITDSIRTVDQQHIIIIEGNWFANDFTGLTPPWDPNMVYSPHKYWSTNDTASMQWVLDIRENFNVPLYLGESGENSNVWFRDAIRLLEDLHIGWAWWPLKKIESISCPLSVPKTPGYQLLLDYWNGNGPKPSAAYAKITLMVLADLLKTEHCKFQRDVIDAMFRQVESDETIPFHGMPHQIPGIIHAPDYDLGIEGAAYSDNETATYHVSTGTYSAWNRGWAYRNDGVDIESSTDIIHSNGYAIGFIESEEWLQYEVNAQTSGVFDLNIRVASDVSGGQLQLSSDGANLTGRIQVGQTGGWQNWKTLTINDLVLDSGIHKLRVHIPQGGFNMGSLEFINTGVLITQIPTSFVSASTIDEERVAVDFNKPLGPLLQSDLADFELSVNGQEVPLLALESDSTQPRRLILSAEVTFKGADEIRLSYSGNQIQAADGTFLTAFTNEPVSNTLVFVHTIPGRIQAEAFDKQSGIQLEQTSDAGGGQNVGYLDPGDWMEYEVNILEAGLYRVDFRTAALSATGGLELQLKNKSGAVAFQDAVSFSPTGGWQNWQTNSSMVNLPAGRFTLRLSITSAPFNLNWLDFNMLTTGRNEVNEEWQTPTLFPNPTTGTVFIHIGQNTPKRIRVQISTINGQLIRELIAECDGFHSESLQLEDLPDGMYIVTLFSEDGHLSTKTIQKISN